MQRLRKNKEKIDNIFENQKNNMEELDEEIINLMSREKEKLDKIYAKTKIGNEYLIKRANLIFNETCNYLINKVKTTDLLISEKLKLFVEFI